MGWGLQPFEGNFSITVLRFYIIQLLASLFRTYIAIVILCFCQENCLLRIFCPLFAFILIACFNLYWLAMFIAEELCDISCV